MTPGLPGRPGAATPDTESRRRFRRFALTWIPVVLALVVIELTAGPFGDGLEQPVLAVLTVLAGAAVVFAARALSRDRSGPVLYLAAVLIDAAAVGVGFLSSAGNDAAIFLPYIGAVLLVGELDGRRLLLAFGVQWIAGMVGAIGAFGFSDLRHVPDVEPLAVSLGSAAVMTFIGYSLLWWVRQRLSRAIGEARHAETLAHASAQALAALLRSSPVPTIGVALDGLVQTWNPAAETAFGWRRDEAVGRELGTLVTPDAAGRRPGWMLRILVGETVRAERVAWLSRSGADRAVDIHAASLLGTDGRPVGAVIQAIDETERDMLRARMSDAERLEAVGRLAGGIAHDFNNLLTAVSGFAELLEDDLDIGDPRRAHASEIGRAAARGGDLVRQLMAFGRRQPFKPVALDLAALVDGLYPMLARLIGAGIRIDVEHGHPPCHVSADPGQLEQVLVNLVINARDAMPDGGTVAIRTARERGADGTDRAILEVRDTGTGMDAATAARIFEPFFTTKPASRGTGLGLATAYGIIRAHGGSIEVTSSVGAGSTFRIELPAIEGAAKAATVIGRPEVMPAGTETVLVVDDEDLVRRFTAQAVAGLGYRVLEAGDLGSALRAAAEPGRIDLILSDMVMPDVRGPEVVRRVAEVHPGVRVLYMSGYAEEVPFIEDDATGTSVLAKPFTVAELASSLRRQLDALPIPPPTP